MRRIIVSISVIGLFLSACTETQSEEGDNAPELISINADELATLLKQKRADNEKALLINVWATWCGPCVEEFPIITGLAEKHEQDLEVMFISGDFPQYTARVKTFLEKQGVDWDTYLKAGSEFTFIEALHSEWSGALPFTVIYNKQGEEVAYWENKADSVIFDSYINKAVTQ